MKKSYIKKIKFVLLFALFLVISFYLYKVTSNYVDNQKVINSLYNYISTVNEKDIDAFLFENDNTILYVNSIDKNNNYKYEIELKEYIIKNNLKDKFIYFNTSNIPNISEYFTNFNILYEGNASIVDIPSIVVIKNGKIETVLYKSNLNISSLHNYLRDFYD